MTIQSLLQHHRLVNGCFFLKFTPREKDVTALVVAGLSNKEIAHALGLSRGTIKQYLGPLMKKLKLKNREDLAVAWITAEVLMNPEKWAAEHSGPFAERFLR